MFISHTYKDARAPRPFLFSDEENMYNRVVLVCTVKVYDRPYKLNVMYGLLVDTPAVFRLSRPELSLQICSYQNFPGIVG
jgi:hypothetical protein